MKIKKIKTAGMIALLVGAILAIVILGFSCVSGLAPVGWSGGTASGGVLYVGSLEGRLVSYNIADQSILRAEPLKLPQQSGILGCSSATAGCGGGSSRVPIYGTPVVSDNIVYVAGYNGRVYAHNIANLAQKWVFPGDAYAEAFVGSMAVADGKLFVGCSDGYVYSLDAATGVSLHYFKTEDKIWGAPTVEGNTLYIGSFDKNIYALNTADLTLKWSFPTEGSVIAKPLVYDGVVYVGSFDRNLYALNASDGSLKWQYMAGNWFWSQPVIVNGTLYAGCLDGFVYAFKPATGELIKSFEVGSQLASQPVVFDNYVIFAAHGGGIHKINSTTQEITTAAVFESNIDGSLEVYEGILYFQTQDARLQRIDISSGAILPAITLVSQ